MSSIKEKYKYLGKNTLIFAISSFSTKFLSFLLVPLYTSFLSTAEYGKIDLITTTSTLLVYVLTINIADSVLRFTIENVKESEKILAVATMFNTLTAFIGSVFSAVKKTKIIAITTVTSALVNTILNACLIPLFGAYGAAIATVIAYITMYTIRLVVLQDVIKLQTNWGENILTYMLLFLQVIFEHMDRHFYIGQIICLISICLINYRLMQTMIEMLKNRILQRRS